MHPQFNWNAIDYFKFLVESNKLAVSLDMKFFTGSGLNSFEQAVDNFLETLCFCMLTESSDGRLSTENSPNSRRVKTVFLAMRHGENDDDARRMCIDTLTEVFRQFMSHLIREKIKLLQLGIYLEPVVEFHEFNEFYFSGCAAIYFHIPFTTAVDLTFDKSQWN